MTDRPETSAARSLYALSPYLVAPELVRSVARVKVAAARCNAELGHLSAEQSAAIVHAARALAAADEATIAAAAPIDAFQGGAGTSTHMAVNEWIASRATAESGHEIDAHAHANLHQSTNDVMPTALRLTMLDRLVELELACESLQSVLQAGEERFQLHLSTGMTQLRDAVTTSLGRRFATWSHTVARDRWRCFKARERIREVNLGATAIGTGAGAPRRYVLGVIRFLQAEVDHPVSRADHLGEATSNYDQVVEALDAPRCLAVGLRRIASDIRLLASGPRAGFGDLELPPLLPGSSIMAGKVNPVIPEAVIQCAERILANDALVARLAAMSELELNAFFPAIAHTCLESLALALGACRALTDYVPRLAPRADDSTPSATGGPRRGRRENREAAAQAEAVALLPLLPYASCEALLREAERRGESLRSLLTSRGTLTTDEAEAIFDPANLLALGYDEELYETLRLTRLSALQELVRAAQSEETT